MKKNSTLPAVAHVTARPPIDLEAAWTYAQETGDLQQDGKHISTGYSGANEGKNNPAMDNVPNVGPIPRRLDDRRPSRRQQRSRAVRAEAQSRTSD